MNTKDLIKKLLPGLFPLLIFIVADEIFETSTSILIAVSVGIVQATWIFIKEKRIDYFVLIDTFLIVMMGGISLMSDNDLFFKLKPGIVELILCMMLLLLAFLPSKYLLLFIGRYGISVPINDSTIKPIKKNLKILSLICILHTFLVFYSAFYMSKEAWAFISGVLFYLIFGIYLLLEFFKNYFKRKKIEWLPIVDNSGKILGKVVREEAHRNKDFLHPVIHLHLFNNDDKLFVQKRKKSKLVMPGKWDTAVGGHVLWGENIEQTIKRETQEELGFDLISAKFIGKYIWESDIEKELVYVFISEWNEQISINRKELEDGKFWSKNDVLNNLKKGIFTPNFENEWPMIIKYFNKKQRKF